MKRIFFIFPILFAVLLCGCSVQVRYAGAPVSTSSFPLTAEPAEQAAASKRTEPAAFAKEGEIRAVWVSYTELNPEKLKSEPDFRRRTDQLLAPMKALSVTDVFLQVRPFADAIYPSARFASSSAVVRRRGDPLPFDFLAVFLSRTKEAGMRVHAWINPYRVSNSAKSLSAFASDPAVGPLLKLSGPPCVRLWNGGVYLDPSSEAVQKLIVGGVCELLGSYDLAGIHIDDYFYPTEDPSFDKQSYEAYLSGGGKAELAAFRRANVSSLLRRLYQTVKSFGAEKVFSVSPAADIEKNENALGADVRLWGSKDGFCDWLIPQLYFGFCHETRPFETSARAWRNLCTNKNVRLLAGLAAYKVGKEDAYAGSGKGEWTENPALLAEQVQVLRREGYDGFALFSSTFLNFDKKLSAKVLKNLKDVL